jgi:hypothetical protein
MAQRIIAAVWESLGSPAMQEVYLCSMLLDMQKSSMLHGIMDEGNRPPMVELRNSGFLYTLNPVSRTINGFQINGDGSLTPVAHAVTGIPIAGQGLAAQ